MNKELLDILTNEYKLLLSNKCQKENFSTEELINFDKKIKSQFFYQEKNNHENKLLVSKRGYKKIRFSLLYIFIGLIMYVYSLIFTKFESYSQQIELFTSLVNISSLIISVVGLYSLIMTIFKEKVGIINHSEKHFSSIKHSYLESSNERISLEIISLWNELESSIYHEQSDLNTSPIRYIMENKSLNDKEKKYVRDFLQLRNSVVHYNSSDFDYSKTEIESIFDEIKTIIKKMNNNKNKPTK